LQHIAKSVMYVFFAPLALVTPSHDQSE
jgi:hypothetical protein